jgi:glycosyltransferase involved in cell wall biosynthesis
MKDIWKSRAREKGLENHFVFTGHVPYRQVPVYLGAMDVCVAPHHEDTNQASPVKLFDYMAAGRPIVASDLDVVQEIINNSGCATVIPPNNDKELSKAILAIILDPIKRNQMSHKGREFAVIHYDRKHLTKSLFQIDFHG